MKINKVSSHSKSDLLECLQYSFQFLTLSLIYLRFLAKDKLWVVGVGAG